MTLTGIQALRSAVNEGTPMEVPDFRSKEVRERYRNDRWMAPHIDPERLFPDDQDISITGDFTAACKEAFPLIALVRSALDGMKVYEFVCAEQKISVINKVKELRSKLPDVIQNHRRLRRIAEAYPDSQGGIALFEKLELGEEKLVLDQVGLTEKLTDFLLNA